MNRINFSFVVWFGTYTAKRTEKFSKQDKIASLLHSNQYSTVHILPLYTSISKECDRFGVAVCTHCTSFSKSRCPSWPHPCSAMSFNFMCIRKIRNIMIEFFPPNFSRALLPFFAQIAKTGLILPRWGLNLPRIPPPIPVLYSAVTHTFLGYVQTQNTPKPTSKQPFSWPELESGQNELARLGNSDPNWAKMFEKWTKLF